MSPKKTNSGFELKDVEKEVLNERMISIRVPEEYKLKYDIIQARSKKRFAQFIRDRVIASIQEVDLDTGA